MRVISWNMGCAHGSAYKKSQPRTWQQLLVWDPDLALIQETLRPGDQLDPDTYCFTPYGWSKDIGTLVYAKAGGLKRHDAETRFLGLMPGQVALVEVTVGETALLVASIHAATTEVSASTLGDMDLAGVGGSHTSRIYPLDLILEDLTTLTSERRFIVGGDLNASVRFDDLYTQGSQYYGNVEIFNKAREADWWNPHRKFNTGDQRTLFRPGKPYEHFQIDHLFTDKKTWKKASRCEVLSVPMLQELTDHAPLLLEIGASEVPPA